MRARTPASLVLLVALAVPLHVLPARAADVSDQVETPPNADETRPLRFKVEIDAPRPYEKMLEEGLDLMRWQESEQVTLPLLERLVAEARKAATEALAAGGYFSPEIKSSIETPAPGRALVRMKVEPGPRTRVRGVDLDFTGAVTADPEGRERMKTVRQTWSLLPGSPFEQSDWANAKDNALAILGRGRYAAARIASSEARIIPDERAADLALRFDSGPIFHAGRVNVTGLKRYPPSVVENMSPHRRGEPYDATKLDLYQRRLLETGYFNAVHFAIDPDPDQSAAAPLNVSVIEAPSQRIDTGIAYSTDTGIGLTVDYGNADIFESAHRFRALFDLNEKRQGVNLTIDAPPRPGAMWNSYWTRLERSDIEGQISNEAVVGYGLNWGLERVPTQLALSAHFENQKIEGSTTDNNYALFLNYRKTFRTTEDLVTPRQGLIGTAEIGTSIPGASSQEFIRGRVHVNWLIPAGLRNDILVRGEAGVVLAESRDGIPSSFLFRTGGDLSIRGYQYQSIGVTEGKATVGGRYLVLGSVEYTRWITDSLGAAVFVDAGDAFDDTGAFDVAMGYGIGVRWKSPVGPLRGDIAYGERDSRIRLHFSVGYNF